MSYAVKAFSEVKAYIITFNPTLLEQVVPPAPKKVKPKVEPVVTSAVSSAKSPQVPSAKQTTKATPARQQVSPSAKKQVQQQTVIEAKPIDQAKVKAQIAKLVSSIKTQPPLPPKVPKTSAPVLSGQPAITPVRSDQMKVKQQIGSLVVAIRKASSPPEKKQPIESTARPAPVKAPPSPPSKVRTQERPKAHPPKTQAPQPAKPSPTIDSKPATASSLGTVVAQSPPTISPKDIEKAKQREAQLQHMQRMLRGQFGSSPFASPKLNSPQLLGKLESLNPSIAPPPQVHLPTTTATSAPGPSEPLPTKPVDEKEAKTHTSPPQAASRGPIPRQRPSRAQPKPKESPAPNDKSKKPEIDPVPLWWTK